MDIKEHLPFIIEDRAGQGIICPTQPLDVCLLFEHGVWYWLGANTDEAHGPSIKHCPLEQEILGELYLTIRVFKYALLKKEKAWLLTRDELRQGSENEANHSIELFNLG